MSPVGLPLNCLRDCDKSPAVVRRSTRPVMCGLQATTRRLSTGLDGTTTTAIPTVSATELRADCGWERQYLLHGYDGTQALRALIDRHPCHCADGDWHGRRESLWSGRRFQGHMWLWASLARAALSSRPSRQRWLAVRRTRPRQFQSPPPRTMRASMALRSTRQAGSGSEIPRALRSRLPRLRETRLRARALSYSSVNPGDTNTVAFTPGTPTAIGAGGLSTARIVAIDGAGNVWLADNTAATSTPDCAVRGVRVQQGCCGSFAYECDGHRNDCNAERRLPENSNVLQRAARDCDRSFRKRLDIKHREQRPIQRWTEVVGAAVPHNHPNRYTDCWWNFRDQAVAF